MSLPFLIALVGDDYSILISRKNEIVFDEMSFFSDERKNPAHLIAEHGRDVC